MINSKNPYFEQMTRLTTVIVEVKINMSEGLSRGEMQSLPGVRFELNPLLTTWQKSVCFDVTSRVDMDCARSLLRQIGYLSRLERLSIDAKVVCAIPTWG